MTLRERIGGEEAYRMVVAETAEKLRSLVDDAAEKRVDECIRPRLDWEFDPGDTFTIKYSIDVNLAAILKRYRPGKK